jgi:hypothetical protein
MSSEAVTGEKMIFCANCGISAVDDVELKMCHGGCDLVKCCSDECQDNHKKRKDELRDKQLFTQPDGSNEGECPLCCLPLPMDPIKSTFMDCCSKLICNGCHYGNTEREDEMGLENRCAFCREPFAKSKEEFDKNIMKRINKNDPAAMRYMGIERHNEGDYETAFEYFTKAAELGDAAAHFELACLYDKGRGVEKDDEKRIYHLEEAAIGGHPIARYNLGIYEKINGRFDRARKHFIISAALGYHDSLKEIKELYRDEYASKEDYADALRAYQTTVDATKSSGRERAEEALKNGEMKWSY